MSIPSLLVESLTTYRSELQLELDNILHFWIEEAVDESGGGFYGKIDNANTAYPGAPKGSVLNSRILWSFSSGYDLSQKAAYLTTAERAYNYIRDKFFDKEFGGVFWTVDHQGNPLDQKKHFYAISFAIYGLAEYVKCSDSEEAMSLAIELYRSIIEYSYDDENGGYIEALSRRWKPMEDFRLSEKDRNEKKSMNTHLHILEGFANLFLIWPDEQLKKRIVELIEIFLAHIIDRRTYHLKLFFDEKWNSHGDTFSYGHDIEAAWLIQEAAEIISDYELLEKVKRVSVAMAKSAAEGLDGDGGLWYEYYKANQHLTKEKHWWPQSEAMIGFFNAWQISGNKSFLDKSIRSWKFVKDHILDKKKGEWFWGVDENYEVMNEDKVGLWKCPYHNSRACIELIKRIDGLTKED